MDLLVVRASDDCGAIMTCNQNTDNNTEIILLYKNVHINFVSAKNRYQIEVPESATSSVPDKYTLQSQRKGYKRYWTADIEATMVKLTSAEERRDHSLKDTMRTIFHKFDEE